MLSAASLGGVPVLSLLSLKPASCRVWARVPDAAAAMVSASSACEEEAEVEASDVRSDLFSACANKRLAQGLA